MATAVSVGSYHPGEVVTPIVLDLSLLQEIVYTPKPAVVDCNTAAIATPNFYYCVMGSRNLPFVQTDLGSGAFRISTTGAILTAEAIIAGYTFNTNLTFNLNRVWKRRYNTATQTAENTIIASNVDHIDVSIPGLYSYEADSNDADIDPMNPGPFYYVLHDVPWR